MLIGESLSVIDDGYLIMQKIEMLPGLIATHAMRSACMRIVTKLMRERRNNLRDNASRIYFVFRG